MADGFTCMLNFRQFSLISQSKHCFASRTRAQKLLQLFVLIADFFSVSEKREFILLDCLTNALICTRERTQWYIKIHRVYFPWTPYYAMLVWNSVWHENHSSKLPSKMHNLIRCFLIDLHTYTITRLQQK